MALKFKCNHCDTEIISKFLKVGEEAKCKFCDTSTLIPDNAEEVDDNEYDKYTTKLKKVKIAPSVNKDKKERKQQLKEIANDESLSKMFGFLSAFQVLIVLSMFIYTAMYLIGLPDSMKIADRMNNYTLVIISTVSFLLFLFNSVCIYSIVNFLFKLDKTKSDKSSST